MTNSQAALPNAKLWIQVWCDTHSRMTNVKLKLKPGQTIEWITGGDTEEGYSVTFHTYRYLDWKADPGITKVEYTRSQDCDGRYDYEQEWWAPLDKLQEIESRNPIARTLTNIKDVAKRVAYAGFAGGVDWRGKPKDYWGTLEFYMKELRQKAIEWRLEGYCDVKFPDWHEFRYTQRDHSAERAGY